jgi:hypothetical protein
MSNVTFFNQKRHSMSSHGRIKSDIACRIVHVQTKENHSQNTFFFYLHCIVEISLELTVKTKNYNEKCLSHTNVYNVLLTLRLVTQHLARRHSKPSYLLKYCTQILFTF